MRVSPLHERFGVEVHDIDLRDGSRIYAGVRSLFEEHSLLLFRNQVLDDAQHLALGELFGTIEIREHQPALHDPAMSLVSNVADDGTVSSEDSGRVHQLKANMLWHTDSTFLPWPALANIIAARTLPDRGGETEFVSTRVAWEDMPCSMKERTRGRVLRHRYSHSRSKISRKAAGETFIRMWPDTAWNTIWTNPVNGKEALYIASHAFAVVGMPEDEGCSFIDELIAFCTRADYVYAHVWEPGDVLIWDERATMHRARPWPYEQPRTLASICINAREEDGLASVRPNGLM